MSGHFGGVICVDVACTRRVVASSSCDGSVRVWSVDSRSCVRVLGSTLSG